MAFPSMREFFIDPKSMDMEQLSPASDDRTKSSHKFPYDQIPSGVKIRYHHYGEMAWSQSAGEDIRVLILIIRVPEKSLVSDYYQLWAFDKQYIEGLISAAGKISVGTIRTGVGIPKDAQIQLKSKEIEAYGAKFFEGTYQSACKWIDGFAESDEL